MARSASEKEMDYVYFSKIYSKRVDKDGQVFESLYFHGPYMDKRSAKRQANETNRSAQQQRDSNRLGPNAIPDYYGNIYLEKNAEVVRSKLVLEVVV